MKSIYLLLLAFVLFISSANAQYNYGKIVKEYYRVNPFEGNFSSFVKALSEDPELHNKQLIQKTDTSNYFLMGTYNVFNPFSFNAKRVEMIFAERDIELVVRNQQETETVYTYQILAYFDDNATHRRKVVQNYNKIKKRLRREFSVEVSTLKGVQNIEDGEISNFYSGSDFVYPVTLSWQTLGQSKRVALTIITKLAVSDNMATPAGKLILKSKPNVTNPAIENFFSDIDSF